MSAARAIGCQGTRPAIVGKLEGATEDVEQAVERVETVIAANADSQAPLDDLERATRHFEDAVQDASTNGARRERPLLGAVEEESAGSSAAAHFQKREQERA